MAAPNLTNLVLSLASAMAGAAGGGCTVGGDLFIHQSPTVSDDQAFAVLRIYGGPVPEVLRRIPAISVQCMVRSMSAVAGFDLASRLYESLHVAAGDLAGRPRCHWTIDGKQIDAGGDIVADDVVAIWDIRYLAIQGPPGILGVDDAGRQEISFNFDVHFSQP